MDGEAVRAGGGLDCLRERDLLIQNRRGLHARASAKFARLSEAFEAAITVGRDGQTVGGTSIMGLLMLGAAKGSTIRVTAEGPDADMAIAAIAALVESRFGEED